MIEQFIRDKKTGERLLRGKFGPYVEGFAGSLSEQGYRRQGITYRLRIVGVFGQWLDRQGTEVSQIDEETLARFLKYRLKRRCRHGADEPGLRLFLEHLRERRVVRQVRPRPHRGKIARVLQGYERYLEGERALAIATRETTKC